MVVKLYAMLWLLLAVISGGLFLTGYFDALTIVVLGFICYGLIFMGMIGVLPAAVTHNSQAK